MTQPMIEVEKLTKSYGGKRGIADVSFQVGEGEVFVFNIGGNVRFDIRDTTSRVYRKVWEMTAFAGFLTAREAAKVMVPRGKGTMLFTGATASIRGGRGFAAFSSAKFGLRAVAQAMARELGPKNIHVVHLLIDAGVDSELMNAITVPLKFVPSVALIGTGDEAAASPSAMVASAPAGPRVNPALGSWTTRLGRTGRRWSSGDRRRFLCRRRAR